MTVVIALVAVGIVAWFAIGTIRNVRLGHEVMRWMQDGLPVLGRRTTVRWLGSSVVELAIHDAEPPFAEVTVVVFLVPRDLPWGWPLARLRGRRDTLIVRGVLRKAPRTELEALDPASWSGRDALPRVPKEWAVDASRTDGIRVHHAGEHALELAGELLALAPAPWRLVRLSLRRREPNIQLHVALPDRREPARAFFAIVRTLAARAAA